MKHGKKMLAVLTALSMLAGVTDSRSMTADAAYSCTVTVTMGTSETVVYGVPNAFQDRFERISARVYGFYRGAFNAQVNMVMPTTNYIKTLTVDECTNSMISHDMVCWHENNNANCSNDGPLHHTNIAYNLVQAFSGSTNTNREMFIASGYFCVKDPRNSSIHANVGGVTSLSTNKMIVRDTDHAKIANVGLGNYENVVYVAGNAVHELGTHSE